MKRIAKALTLILIVLFLMEVLLLLPKGFSWRGVWGERFFLYFGFILSFYAFGLKKAVMGWLIFIILSMLPMFIPFIMLLQWSLSPSPSFPQKSGGRYEYSSEFGANRPLIQKVKAVNLILEKCEPPIYLMESIEIEGLGVKNRRDEFSNQVGMGIMPEILEIEERDSLIKISWMLNSQKKLYYLKTGSIQ